jgi:NAD(P)-dependent dehydrogenase (short-subunit alcohol dehydrogenase family)
MADPAETVSNYPSLLGLAGKAFVILGSGYGIGRETCRAITQAGGEVLCVDRDEAIARAVAAEVGAEAVVADLTRQDEMEAVFARADTMFGKRLAGFVDVAGLAVIKPLEELDDDTWTLQMDQTFRHAHLALRAALPRLRANGGGAITYVGSLTGILTFRKQIAYGAAKAALHQLVRGAAYELAGDGIRVNAVAPGFVKTPSLTARLSRAFWDSVDAAIPTGRAAESSDIASAILYLQSPLAAYVTGQILVLDGAMANAAACPQI